MVENMISRKNGETHKQFTQRLEGALKTVTENNRALRKHYQDSKPVNPRTGKTFESEANELFTTVALIEQELRQGDPETAKLYAQGMLTIMGFDMTQILTDHCLKDDVYTNG